MLFCLFLLQHDAFLVTALEDSAALLEFEVSAVFEDFASGFDLWEVHLGLHGVVMHSLLDRGGV